MDSINRQGGRGTNNTHGRGRGVLQRILNPFTRNSNQERPERSEQQETTQIGWEHPRNLQPQPNTPDMVTVNPQSNIRTLRANFTRERPTLERSDSMMGLVNPDDAAAARARAAQVQAREEAHNHDNTSVATQVIDNTSRPQPAQPSRNISMVPVVDPDDAAAARNREEARRLRAQQPSAPAPAPASATSLGTEDDISQRQAEHFADVMDLKAGKSQSPKREFTTNFGKKEEEKEKAKLLEEHFNDSIKQALALSLEEAKKAVLGVASRPAKEPSPELSKEEFIKRIRDMGFSDKIKHIEKKIKNLEKDNSDIDYNDLLNEFIDNLNNNDSASDVDKKPAAK